ncbi:replicative DNA helicase [Mameliella sp.]|uniref:replicative DNA helicase n=1 Tax=Mameliella sp. TaxID=1924940 RepID=UPI003BAB63FC
MAEVIRLNQADEVSPHSIEGEQQVLGAIILDQSRVPVVAQVGGPDLFFDPVHADIYRYIARCERDGVHSSVVTMRAWADEHEGIRELGGSSYLVRLAGACCTESQLGSMVDFLAETRAKRGLYEAISEARRALSQGEASAAQIAGQLEASVVTLEGGTGPRPISMMSATTTAGQQIMAAHEGRAGDFVPTGIHAVDRLLNGLYPGELILLGGRPSMGKTATAINMAANAARAGRKVVFCSLEMNPEAIALRLLSERMAATGNAVAYRDLRGGKFNERAREDLGSALEEVAQLPIEFLPRQYQDVGALLAGAKRTKAKMGGLDLLVVDYVQLMRSAQAKNRYETITEVSRALKNLAGMLNVPVLALSQLSRAVEQRDDKRPRMDDLRESGQLEQDADAVLFCYRDEYYLERERPETGTDEQLEKWEDRMRRARNRLEIIVAKQRQGPVGTANVFCNVAFNRIWEPEQ